MRTITNPGFQSRYSVTQVCATDEPDGRYGGANHTYEVCDGDGNVLSEINFQHGPIGEVGVNGVQHAELLEIVADRLRSFQRGKFASTLNEIALAGVIAALAADRERTVRRSLAGIEGSNMAEGARC